MRTELTVDRSIVHTPPPSMCKKGLLMGRKVVVKGGKALGFVILGALMVGPALIYNIGRGFKSPHGHLLRTHRPFY